jgi:hypothetical protein
VSTHDECEANTDVLPIVRYRQLFKIASYKMSTGESSSAAAAQSAPTVEPVKLEAIKAYRAVSVGEL